MRDLIQSEKEISRPSQEEVGFREVAGEGEATCASCRWFKAEGAYCHLVQNTPKDLSGKSRCERHEVHDVPIATDMKETDVKATETPLVETDSGVFVVDEPPDPLPALLADTFREIGPPPATKDRIWNRLAERLGFTRREVPEQTGIKVSGNHFFIAWSNNFEDREGEIFTAKAMDDYVRRVDLGLIEPPDLVVWHLGAQTKMGKAAFVARHGHFLIAAGQFDDTRPARRAKAYYQRHAKNTAISHGYTYPANQFDGRHYHAFNTFEISLLPRGREANRFTSLERIKEMTVTPEKEKYLREVFGEDADTLLAPLDELGKSLEAMGVEFKDFTAVPETDADATAEAVEADVKALVSDLVADTARIAEWTLAVGKALKDNKDAFDARLADLTEQYKARFDEQAAQIAALHELLDGRPRQASKADETTLDILKDPDRLSAIAQQADKQTLVRDSYWGTVVPLTATGA